MGKQGAALHRAAKDNHRNSCKRSFIKGQERKKDRMAKRELAAESKTPKHKCKGCDHPFAKVNKHGKCSRCSSRPGRRK